VSAPTVDYVHDGLAFGTDTRPIFTRAHTGSVLRNLGDLILTLPGYSVITLEFDQGDGYTWCFRGMVRDIPFGHESETRTSRRITNLDAGTEFFLHVDETHKVLSLRLEGED
jgi:hypothetical protein